jgi:hypothetical protein
MRSPLYHEQKGDLLTVDPVHKHMKKPSMKNTWKKEHERSCEHTSQKSDSLAPVQVSNHQRWLRDIALPRSAAQRMKGRQGGETTPHKVSQFSDSRINRANFRIHDVSYIY